MIVLQVGDFTLWTKNLIQVDYALQVGQYHSKKYQRPGRAINSMPRRLSSENTSTFSFVKINHNIRASRPKSDDSCAALFGEQLPVGIAISPNPAQRPRVAC